MYMKKNYKKTLTSKLYLLALLCWISISQSSCLINYYSPDTTLSFTGTTSYCQGAVASSNTLTYDQCTLGLGLIDDGVPYTAQWYYNTTGSTSIGLSTPLGGPIAGTSPTSGPGTESYTPLTTSTGTFYYFCYFTWSTTGTCTSSFTSTTQTITITPPAAAVTGTASLCVSGSTTLSSSVSGGTWASGSPSIATVSGGVVSGVAPGTAVISYTLSGCTTTRIVTVYAAPAAINPTTPVTICQGATTTFTDATPLGTWSSSNTAVATVTSGGLVSGAGGGTATITYTLTSTGCYSTKAITVNPIPGPIAGPTQVCPLGNITLTNASPGGTWSSSAVGTATVNATTGIVTGVAPGTVTISYTGCGTVTYAVSVHPSPASITGPTTVCQSGGTITMSSLTVGGSWSSGAPAFATATTSGPTTGLITGLTLGTAPITYTSTLGCVTSVVATVVPLPTAIVGSVPICAGQTMTLTNTVAGGTWSSVVPGIASVDPVTGVVTGMSGGTTIISYTNNCGTVTVPVTINSTPVAIVGRDTVCVGSTTVFTDATIGGSWSSSGSSVASVLTGSGIVTGVAVGAALITYTMPGGCYTTTPVFVEPAAAPISSSTLQVCPTNTITLSNPVPGGTWSSSAIGVANVGLTTGVVTGVSADTAVITYTNPAGCTSFATVTVNPAPAPIVGGTTLCATLIDTLFDPTPGGTWSSTTPFIATVDAATGIVTTISGGTATIRYTLPTGCFVSKSFTVKSLPGPIVTYNSDLNTFFTDPGYLTYQWYDSLQGLIPGATSNHTAALYFGYYYVVVTNSEGCVGPSAHHPYNKTIGFSDPKAGQVFRVYPNPTTELVHIDAPIPVRAVISSVDGKSQIDRRNAKEIDISMLPGGLYHVSLYDDNDKLVSVHKLVKH